MVTEIFSDLNGLEVFFLVCAVVGAFFVGVKLVLQFLGGDGDLDTDIDAHHADSDVGFKLLSLHGLTSFLMMFGLVGLALYRQSRVGVVVSMAGAVAAGLASVWLIGRLFGVAARMQSSGTLPASSAVGSTGTVYLKIPAGGTGRATINVRSRLREFDAVSADGGEIPTGTPVRVVRVDAGVMVVEKLN